jgi:hypothetical protein
MSMSRMKNRFVFFALSLGLIGVTGCAKQPAPPAPPSFTSTAPEVRTSLEFGGVLVSIYHPDTRTLYLWSGDPRPNVHRPMTCIKMQLSDTPSGSPKSEPCESDTPAPSGNAH